MSRRIGSVLALHRRGQLNHAVASTKPPPSTSCLVCALQSAVSPRTNPTTINSGTTTTIIQSQRPFSAHLYQRQVTVNTNEQILEAAKNALLQFNIMIDQGIEPSVSTYAVLIAQLGKAGFEWQAYKLFSRMLESGVMPTPEAYVALLMATNSRRTAMRREIEEKLREAIAGIPEALAEDIRERNKNETEEAQRWERMLVTPGLATQRLKDRLMQETEGKGVEGQPGAPGATAINGGESDSAASEKQQHEATDGTGNGEGTKSSTSSTSTEKPPMATMHLDSLESVLAAVKLMDAAKASQQEGTRPANANPNPAAVSLIRTQLGKLHEEELKILLTIHRQLRSEGAAPLPKERLIDAVMANVPEKSITAMMKRREKYFGAVKSLLEEQLAVLEAEGLGSADATQPTTGQPYPDNGATSVQASAESLFDDHDGESTLSTQERTDKEAPTAHAVSRTDDAGSALQGTNVRKDVSTVLEGQRMGNDVATTVEHPRAARDAYFATPEVLETPWGPLRRPKTAPPVRSQGYNPDRDLTLTDDDLMMLYTEATTSGGGGVYDVPENILRRYARQFHLPWKRGFDRALGGAEGVENTIDDDDSVGGVMGGGGAGNSGNRPSLAALVRWHITTYPPAVVPSEVHQQYQREKDQQAVTKTLDAVEVISAFARRCGNVKVTDAADINRKVTTINRVREMAQKSSEQYQQRQRHFAAVEKLRNALPRFLGSSKGRQGALEGEGEQGGGMHKLPPKPKVSILGISSSASSSASSFNVRGSRGERNGQGEEEQHEFHERDTLPSGGGARSSASELPPWMVENRSDQNAFNFVSGTFGSPDHKQVLEMHDGTFRPSNRPRSGVAEDSSADGVNEMSPKHFEVDEDLLPPTLQRRVREELSAKDQFEAQQQRWQDDGSKAAKYRKTHHFFARSKVKREEERQAHREAVGNPAAAAHLGQRPAVMLRKGRDIVRVGEKGGFRQQHVAEERPQRKQRGDGRSSF